MSALKPATAKSACRRRLRPAVENLPGAGLAGRFALITAAGIIAMPTPDPVASRPPF